ncbi:hypothetical protein TNCV_3269971 [Trichonephila clavipes]|uniref:Uncharacterized protein n=1 Tax=Trichonephila clavipes TaxID=2585209 RepID=A0A8X6S5R3_TRICX|nr:hypothetical protein TNCV_3269971 [Trichonephila clavipes]
MIHYLERKPLSCIDVSVKAGKVSKSVDAIAIHRPPLPLRKAKRFLRCYGVLANRYRHVKRRPKGNSNGNGRKLILDSRQRSFPT